jgi:PAS domain S-box-containing protein
MGAGDRSVQSDKRTLGGHRHVCAFFNSLDEQYRVLRPFIKDGVDRGERALHIVDPEFRDEHLKRLGEAGIDVERSMASGQLEVRLWQDVYRREDRFDQDTMLALIEEQLQSGAAAGSPRIRLMTHLEWSLRDKPGVDDLLEYEARLNYVLPRYDDPVICTYDLLTVSSSVAMDIMRTHPAVIIGGVLQENPFFVPPDQFLLEIRERRRHAEAPLRLAHDQLEMKVTERAGESWQTSAELQTILDASPVGIVLFRRDQTIQRCNPAFERLVGWTADEIVGHRLPLPESTEPRWTSLVAQLNREERFSGLEIRIMRKDGSEFDAAVTCAPFTGERGRPAGFVANIEYITDRKRAEEALRRSETYLAEAQRLSHTGSWARDMATNEYTHSSDEYARLFGFDPQRDRPPRDDFLQRIHPEDRGRHDDRRLVSGWTMRWITASFFRTER